MGKSSQFSIVPRYVWQGCQPVEVKVYCALASYADWETGVCWPSQQTIAEASGVSLSTVKRAIHTLVAVGAVEVTSRDHNTGKAALNVYQLPYAINRPSTQVQSTRDPNRGVVQSTHDPSVWSTHDPLTRVIEQQKTLPTVVSSELVLFDDGSAVEKSKKKRPRDLFYEAACAALDLPHVNSDERPLGIIASRARKGHHQPDEILRRAALHLATFDFPFTPGSFVKRWDQLGSKVTTATHSQRKRFAAEMDRMRRRQEIVEGTTLLGDEL